MFLQCFRELLKLGDLPLRWKCLKLDSNRRFKSARMHSLVHLLSNVNLLEQTSELVMKQSPISGINRFLFALVRHERLSQVFLKVFIFHG